MLKKSEISHSPSNKKVTNVKTIKGESYLKLKEAKKRIGDILNIKISAGSFRNLAIIVQGVFKNLIRDKKRETVLNGIIAEIMTQEITEGTLEKIESLYNQLRKNGNDE